tara:strand:+ start:128 stop:361 length:234 start_codon:yes stop_codon:yes gene_type:complete
MLALSEQLYNNDWTFVVPNVNKKYKINVFDDGNQNLINNINEWVLFGTWNRKYALFNVKDYDIIIKSISNWKVELIN